MDEDGETEAEGERDKETLADGEKLEEGETDEDGETERDTDADDDDDGETDAEPELAPITARNENLVLATVAGVPEGVDETISMSKSVVSTVCAVSLTLVFVSVIVQSIVV